MLLCKNDICVYFGVLNAVPHAHYAVEITLSAVASLHLHVGNIRPMAFEACIISPNLKHQIVNKKNVEKITIMIDADSPQARALNMHYNLKNKKYCLLKLTDLNHHINRVLQARECSKPSNCDSMFRALSQLIDSLLPADYRKMVKPLDKRIEFIKDHIENNIKLRQFNFTEMAKRVKLSEGYLAHLFKSEIGIPIRKYVAWKRVKIAAFEVQDGLSITQAAYSSGFTDASHLRKVYYRMLGLKASEILKDF